MEVYYLEYPHHMKREEITATVMALGFFDGVHLGHQKVILSQLKKSRRGNGIKKCCHVV